MGACDLERHVDGREGLVARPIGGSAALGFAAPPSSLTLYFEGPPAGVDLQVDGVDLRRLEAP
jgi:hypothetical protein